MLEVYCALCCIIV